MDNRWEKPDFSEIEVNGECTAYAGAKTDWETKAGRVGATGQSHVALAGALRRGPGQATLTDNTADS